MSQHLPTSEVKQIWQTACAQLQLELSPGVYTTWIMTNPLTAVTVEQNRVVATITSPTAFHSTNIKKNFNLHLQKVLTGVLDKPTTINYIVGDPTHLGADTNTVNTNQIAISQTSHPTPSTHASPARSPKTTRVTTPHSNPTPLSTTSQPLTNHQPHLSPTSPRAEQLFSTANIESAHQQQGAVRAKNIGLRSDYTFNTFAVSSSNELAHAAATAVSNKPGTAYNPLFFYGGVGVGKTHLMHAIGHNILHHQSTASIIYCTGEEFTNQIVGAIRNKNAISFKEKYRTVDVLLIDDVQFIAGKNTVQEEFFHTFNALTKRASQIVLTSDRPPHEISLLESRLRSRFEAGLMIDIQQPSFELRTAILLIKAKALTIPLSIEMAKLIAARVDSARKIEGILNSLRSAIELRGQDLSSELVEKILISEADTKRPQLTASIQDVIKTVANHYRLKQAVVKGKSRKKNIALARHIAMYICKQDLDEPYAEIGRWFSHRDHTTVMHAVNKITELTQKKELINQEISAIRMSLASLSQ